MHAAAGDFRVEVCFRTGVDRVEVTFAGLSTIYINGPGCYTGTTVLSSGWTSGQKSVQVKAYASSGYALPTSAAFNSRICVNPCSPNTTFLPAGTTTYTYTGTATHTSYDTYNVHEIAWSGDGQLLAAAPTVTSTAAVSGTARTGQALTGSVTFTGGPTPTETYQWYRCTSTGAATSSVPVDCTAINGATAKPYTATADDAGSYLRFAATASNASGNVTSVSAATGLVGVASPTGVDLTTSSDTGSSSTDDTTKDDTPNITVTGTLAGASVTVTAQKAGSADVSCNFVATGTSGSCDLSTLVDGSWTISAVQAIGTTVSSATAGLPVTVDTTPTSARTPDLAASSDSGSSNSDEITNDNTPTVNVAGVTGTAVVTATKDGVSVTCTVSAGACTLGTLSDGNWSITVAETDAAGNVSTTAAPLSITVDTTAPTVALTSDPPAGSHASRSSFSVTATFSEPVTGFSSTVDITKGGTSSTWTVASSTGSGTSYQFGVSSGSPSSGTLTLQVAAGAATDAAGNSSSISTVWTSSIVSAVPVNSAVPTVSGSTLSGSVLTATNGTWNDQGDASPTTSHKWQYLDPSTSTWTDIAGATGATFTVPESLFGRQLRVGALRTNVVGPSLSYAFSSATSAVTLGPASNSVAPSISGRVAPGETLTATTGTWTGGQNTYAYQWNLNGSPVTGATSASYTVAPGDPAGTLSVTVTATNGNAAPVSQSSVGTPSRPVITAVTPADGQLSVAFTPGATNGSSVTGYVAEATAAGVTVAQSCPSSPCVITGLTGGTSYSVVVRAVTATVTGPDSIPSSGTPTASAPSAPSITAAEATETRGSVRVTFTPGSTNGAVVSGYRVTATATDGSTVTATCASSPCNVTGLSDGKTYTFTMSAVANVSGVPGVGVASSSAPEVRLPAAQTVSFVDITDRVLGSGAVGVSVSATSGLSVTLTSDTPAVCTVSGTTVTLLSAGTCTLRANQGGNTSYYSASATESFEVGPVPRPSSLPAPVKQLIVPSLVNKKARTIDVTAVIGAYPAEKAPEFVVFVVKDKSGKVIDRVSVPLPSGADRVVGTIPALRPGDTVSTYTRNSVGIGGGKGLGASLVRSRFVAVTKVLPSGRPVLAGKKVVDAIIFEPANDALDAADFVLLNKMVSYVRSNGGQVLIVGFARQNGVDSAAFLKDLSLRRARNVAKYLSDRGVRVWIRYDGFGAATKAIGNPKDRKVEIRWVSDLSEVSASGVTPH